MIALSLHRREVEILRRRASSFLKQAELALVQGSYDVACFLSEQALQLYLKSVLLELVGDYPRTHSIRRLLGEVGRILNAREVDEFIRAERVGLIAIEDAYLMSRYFVREYDREEAESIVNLSRKVIEFIEHVLRKKGFRR